MPTVPAIRILPMSNQVPGFRERSIADVQTNVFLRDLPAHGGRYRYRSSGLAASPGTLVLFQFRARIIASALFRRAEPFEKPVGNHAGVLVFDPASIRTFHPLDVAAMRTVWARFRGFGHVKQSLNPAAYPEFTRLLKRVRSPG